MLDSNLVIVYVVTEIEVRYNEFANHKSSLDKHSDKAVFTDLVLFVTSVLVTLALLDACRMLNNLIVIIFVFAGQSQISFVDGFSGRRERNVAFG